MDLHLTLSLAAVARALAILARVTGVLVAAPIFSLNLMPRPTRAVLAIAITAALWTSGPASAATPPAELGSALVGELALGLAMGFTAEFLFAAVELAASVLSFGTGLSYVNAVDPSSPVRSTTLSSFQWLIAGALFLALDGHHLLLQALGQSLALVPAGSARASHLWLAMAPASATIFGFGLALAAPALLVLLLVDLALGLVGRVAPQAQVLMLGMGLKPVAGLSAMSIAYAALPGAFSGALARTVLDLGRIVQAAGAR